MMSRQGAREPLPAADAADEQLVRWARAGDRDAFEALFRSRFPRVSRYVLGLVRDPMLRDDVVAEVFLQAWRRLPTLRQPERFDAWLLRIAHHRAVNELRRQRRSARGGPRGVLEIADPDRMVAPHARLELLSDARTVREALLQLPEAQREALVLHHLAGFGYEEVARQLGRTNAGVRQLCHRALLRLRAALEDR